MPATKKSKSIIREFDSFDNYIKNPLKYHSDCVKSFISNTDDFDKVKAIINEDSRRSVQVHARYKLSRGEIIMCPAYALSEWYRGNIDEKILSKALKSDAKYIDFIKKEYSNKLKETEKGRRVHKPKVAPRFRLTMAKWDKTLDLSKQKDKGYMIDAFVNQIISRGICK